MSQDAPPPPPDEQTMDPVADVPDAVDPDDIVDPAAASQPAVPTQRLASRYTDLLGSEQNASNLVTGLRTGGEVTLDQDLVAADGRSEEHTSELQSLMRISYAVFCLKKKTRQ